jgi:hypothetical protein
MLEAFTLRTKSGYFVSRPEPNAPVVPRKLSGRAGFGKGQLPPTMREGLGRSCADEYSSETQRSLMLRASAAKPATRSSQVRSLTLSRYVALRRRRSTNRSRRTLRIRIMRRDQRTKDRGRGWGNQPTGGRCRFGGFEGGYIPAYVSFCSCSNVEPAL